MYKIIVTYPAQKDLQNAISYISNELKNKEAAFNLLDLVEETVKSLTDMPEKYAVIDDEFLSREDFRFIPIKNYLLLYSVRKETQMVVVQCFLYVRRDWMNILKQNTKLSLILCINKA